MAKDNNTPVTAQTATHADFMNADVQAQIEKIIEMREKAKNQHFGIVACQVKEKQVFDPAPKKDMKTGQIIQGEFWDESYMVTFVWSGASGMKKVSKQVYDLLEDDGTWYELHLDIGDKFASKIKKVCHLSGAALGSSFDVNDIADGGHE